MLAAALIALPFQLLAEQVFPDPVDDLIGLDSDGPDATALIALDLGDALRLDIELANPEMAADLTGLIEIDTSQAIDSLKPEDLGARSRLSLLCPKSTGLGVTRTIDLFARQGSEVPVRDSDDQVIGQALWEETGQGFAVTLDKQLIGFNTGTIDLAAIIGDPTAASDCIPDGGTFTRAEISLHRVMVQASSNAGGTMSPQGEVVADIDESISFDLAPDAGYEIDTVDSSCGGSLDGLTFTTAPIVQGCSVETTFRETPIDGECGPAHGGVLTSVPDDGLCDAGSAGQVSGDGPWSWACEGFAGGQNASCSADIQHYALNYSASAGGAISGLASQSIPHGGSGEPVTAMPNDGYSFEDWSDGSTTNPRTDSGVVSDLDVVARFSQEPTDGECGQADGGVFTSAPSDGLCDAGMASALSGDGPWSWTCEGTGGGESASCSADIQHYTLAYTAGPGGEVSGESNQSVAHGSSGEPVSALPDAGYRFAEWSDGSTLNPRSDNHVVEDLEVRADFIEQTSTVLSSDNDHATVGQAITFTVDVTGTDTAPADGEMRIESDSGESCSVDDRTTTDTTATFECKITFDSAGSRTLTAFFEESSTHEASTSDPLTQAVDGVDDDDTLFRDRFESAN